MIWDIVGDYSVDVASKIEIQNKIHGYVWKKQ